MNTILVLIAVSVFTLVAWRNLKLAILLLLAFLPVYLIRFSIGPIPFTILEVLVLVVMLLWFVRSVPFSSLSILHSPFSIPIFLFLLASTISIFIAPDHLAALGIWRAYFVEPILFFFVIRTVLTTDDDKQHAIKALGIGALLVSLFAILQYVTGYGIPIPWDFERRVTSFFEYPNAVGLYLAPIVTIGVLQLTKKRAWFWGAVVIFGITTIILAKTEAALVAIPAALFFFFFFRTQKPKTKIIIVVSAVLLFFAAFQIPAIQEKLLLNDSSGMVRQSQWRETSEMLRDNWLFGAGLSDYPSALKPYHTDTQYEIFQYPHNLVLNIWSELGLLGLVAFLWLTVLVLRDVIVLPINSTTQRLNDSTTFAIFAALLTMTIHGLVDVPYFKNDLALMTWSLLALLPLKTK